MKFDIPKVLKELDMSLYDQALADYKLQVWVNPNRAVENEFYAMKDRLQQQTKSYEDLLLQYKNADEERVTELNTMMDEINEKTRLVNDNFFQWYSNILSQHSNGETHVSVEELRRVANEDPALWKFIANSVQDLIFEHRERTSKN